MTDVTQPDRHQRLAVLEAAASGAVDQAAAGATAFFRNLVVIKDEELWREGDYESWPDYLLRRWDASRQTGWRWVQQGRALLELESSPQKGRSERIKGRGNTESERRVFQSAASRAGVPSQRSLERSAREARSKPEVEVLDPPDIAERIRQETEAIPPEERPEVVRRILKAEAAKIQAPAAPRQEVLDLYPNPATREQGRSLIRRVVQQSPNVLAGWCNPQQLEQLVEVATAALRLTEPAPARSGRSPTATTGEKCRHPVTRKIGAMCGACGETVSR